MNHEVEREVGELARLRRLRERVMALPRYAVTTVDPNDGRRPWGTMMPKDNGEWIRAADIDAIAREVGSE